MSAKRDREEEIFDAARELAFNERAAYLAERCGPDVSLRQRIEGMLEADAAAGEFFKTREAPPSITIPEDASLSIEKPGDRIGRYKLLQQIGEGGMGLVYMAEQDQPVRRSVALKIIKLGMDTRQVVARFEAERQALAMMSHPHIAKVFDAGATDSGRPYFVMELVRGIPITEYCDKNCLPTRQRLDLFVLVCQAVQHAHQKGVIHRDLKPSNILVTLNDGVPWPMIIDFGIAKAIHQRLTEKTLFTQFAQMIGTPAYMSPEQAEMSKLDVDTRTDIYALGVLLYELLTGTTPFPTKELLSLSYREMQRTIMEREPLRLSTRLSTMANEERTMVAKNRSLDAAALAKLFRGDLDWIAMKCLEKDRARRYETANALAADIRRHLDCEPVVARPPSRWYEFQKTVRRHKFGFTAAGSVIMALAIGLGVSTTQFVQKNRAYHRAAAAEREQSRLRQQAEASQKNSETEAAKATAISDFLQQMLRSANPEALKGSEYTVRQLLDDFSAGLTNQLKDQPEVEAAVRATIGRAYFRLGVTDKALQHQERALMLRRSIFSEQAELVVAESLVDCAWTCFEQMQYAEGEAYAREALEIYGNRGATGQPVIYALWAWQRMLIAQSRFAEVEAVLEQAFALARKSTAVEFPDLASMIHGLADVRNIQSRYAEAETLALKAVTMHRRLHGAQHPETGWALVTLGVALRGQQKLADAETALQEALKIFRKYHSSRHNSVDAAMNELKLVYEARGDSAAVEALYREILVAQRAKLGSNSPALAETLNNLGIVVQRAGKRTEAEELFHEAEAVYRADVATRRQRFGDVHREVDAALFTLGNALEKTGRLAEAESVYREELALERKLSGDEHLFVANSLSLLGSVLLSQGKAAEAEAINREALALRRRLRADDSQLADSLADLAVSLLAQQKFTEAEGPARESLAIREKKSPNDSRTSTSRGTLVTSLLGQKKYAEAEGMSLAEMEARRKLFGEDALLAGSLAEFAFTLLVQQKFTEAEAPARESLRIREKEAPDDWRTFNSRSLLGESLLGQKKYAEAGPHLLSGYEGMKQRENAIPFPWKVRIRQALQRLSRLHETIGPPEKAAEWNKKIAEFDKAAGAQMQAATPKLQSQSQP